MKKGSFEKKGSPRSFNFLRQAIMKTEISYHLFSNTNVSSVGRTKIQFTLSMPVPFVGCKKWENVWIWQVNRTCRLKIYSYLGLLRTALCSPHQSGLKGTGIETEGRGLGLPCYRSCVKFYFIKFRFSLHLRYLLWTKCYYCCFGKNVVFFHISAT